MNIDYFIKQTLNLSGDTLVWINGFRCVIDGVDAGHYLILTEDYSKKGNDDTVRLRDIRGYSFESEELVCFCDDNLSGYIEFKSWDVKERGYYQYDVINLTA